MFPKQTELTTDEETGNLKPGQFINLPYYGGKRRALNVDGTPFDIEKFLKIVEANLVSKEDLTKITDNIDQKIYEVKKIIYKHSGLSYNDKKNEFRCKDNYLLKSFGRFN